MNVSPKLVPAALRADAAVPLPAGRPGLVVRGGGRRYYWEGTGLLSVKSFSGGRALYDTGKGLHAVDDASYLILNDGQPYSITVESERAVESFVVFFRARLAEQVYHSLTAPPRVLLDDPEPPDGLRINFFDQTYPHDAFVSPALASFRRSFAEGKERAGWFEEQLHGLLRQILRARRETLAQASALGSVRASTREELYRRLARARDYIDACYDQPLTLDDVARVACLSPNHLLRSFRQAFRRTPHQHLTLRRLERAREMLAGSELSVTEVCLAVGFESPASFSRLFRRHAGLSPRDYRRKR